jgi:hypothetical protein
LQGEPGQLQIQCGGLCRGAAPGGEKWLAGRAVAVSRGNPGLQDLIDPISLAALLLSIPSAALAVVDLAEVA